MSTLFFPGPRPIHVATPKQQLAADMDATKRPLLIPPQFATYAEKHGIFDMYERLLEQLLIHKPDDPLVFMLNHLQHENDDVPRIVVHGPPYSGKRTISKLICTKLRCAHITMDNLVEAAETALKKEVQGHIDNKRDLPMTLWLKLVEERVKMFDCVKKGWVMDSFPNTREKVQALQSCGIYPRHFVLLEAPDTVLIERAAGKRVDPKTGDVYHTSFDWPNSADVAARLEEVPSTSEEAVVERLVEYHRHVDGINSCFSKVGITINADQPKIDVFSQVMTFLASKPRSATPHTPRVILLGPTGSGKAIQAALLASKYNIINVSCGRLVKQSIADETKLGQACKSYVEKGMLVPDSVILSILTERLGQLDCVSRGWVLHGYPKTREQAEQLSYAGFIPNRAFFLDVPNDLIVERLTLRSTDPITGERYHMLFNPPRTQEVKERLQIHPKDTEEEVSKRLAQFHAYAEELNDYYEDAQHINADQDPHTVFECIESMVVNPLPKRL